MDAVISKHLPELNKPGALSVRPGYQSAGGWLTKKPAVVVTVDQKRDDLPPQERLPETLDHLELLQTAGVELSHVRIQDRVHNKGMIVDSKTAVVSSQNWSGDGVTRNRDAGLIISHEKAADYWGKIFVHDWTRMADQHARD